MSSDGKRVLVLEDDDLLRGVFVRVLDGQGYEVKAAGSNAEAIRIMASGAPDAILMDFNRPHGDALDLMNEICAVVRSRNIGVFVLSGDAAAIRQHGPALRSLGVRAVRHKPLSVPEILTTLSEVVGAPEDGALLLLLSGREGMNVDYKETLDLTTSRAIASLAKDVIAMSNTPGGGNIFFGVRESDGPFEFPGLPVEQQRLFDPTRVNDALKRYVGPVGVQVSLLPLGSLVFGYVGVPETQGRIVLASNEHPEAQLFRGRIYHRTEAARSEEVRDTSLLDEMLERCARARVPIATR